jgi:hypothetical protein
MQHNLQQDEGLCLANKLKCNHLQFASQKMRMNLSVQTLSNSTAQALLCLKDLGYAKFQDCDETVNFIQTMDRLFDMMNSRNPFGKGFKGPLRPVTKHIWLPFLNKADEYLSICKQQKEYFYHCEGNCRLGLTFNCIQSFKSRLFGPLFLATFKVFFTVN